MPRRILCRLAQIRQILRLPLLCPQIPHRTSPAQNETRNPPASQTHYRLKKTRGGSKMTLPKCKKCGCINLRRKINPSGGTRKTFCYQCNTIVFYANRNPIIGEDRLFSIPPELLWPYRGAIE